MKNFQRIAVITLLSLFLIACSGGEEASTATAKEVSSAGSQQFPPMGVDDLDAFLKANPGKPTIIMVWTTWCPSCKEELPEMEALGRSHGDKLNVITVSLDEDVAALETFFQKKKVDLPVYHGDEAFGRKFGIESIPTLLIFDKSGKLIFSEPGIFPHSMLKAMAEKLIAQ